MEHRLERETLLPLPLDEIFPFFADAGNLERITPPQLRFEIDTPLPIEMRLGALIEYRLSLFRVPFRWKTEISRWDPPRGFVDRALSSPFRVWEHMHEFEEVGGQTRMWDRVHYVLPLSPLGDLAHPIVRWQLDQIFDFRESRIPALLADGRHP